MESLTILLIFVIAQTVLTLFMGYVMYITNVKMEEYKTIITTLDKKLTDNHDFDSKLWKEIALVLRKLVEITER